MAEQNLSSTSKFNIRTRWNKGVTFESNHCAHVAEFYWSVDCNIRFPLPGNEWIDAYLVIRRKTQNYIWWSE